ncbi:MAG TPA: long-chain fatty acid--CoA ligase [Pseudonocardiaceae bacterium]|nr:long-chain fatty acid--CoA ligase [Pseudonocardiaceae bacterium]
MEQTSSPQTTHRQSNENLAVVADRAASVAQMFIDRVAQTPDREAYRYPAGGGWVSRTWQETGQQVTRLAAGLVSLGIAAQQRVAIASGTRYEWILADLAVMCAGAATTTVYPSSISGDVAFILADSGSLVVFAEDDEQITKLREQRHALPAVRTVVTFDGTPDEGDDPWVISLDRLGELGAAYLAEHPDTVEEQIAAIRPDHLATLIYTSGTTGRPKGVRLRHSSWTYEGAAIAALDVLYVDDLQYLWLPMAHAFGKVLLTAQLQVGFATAVDGRIDQIVPNLAVVRPTFMGAAPRVFEKAYGRIVATAHSAGWPKAKIFDWACRVALDVSRRVRQGRPVPWQLAVAHKVADKLVLVKVRDRFGGRLRFFISGAAVLSEQIAEWFHAAGILILEAYGLTETSAASVANRPDRVKLGTVGQPLPGTQLRIAEDGEIMIKGPGVMDGYHHLEHETGQALVGDGWLATGDIGEIDADGFLRITDRKKDLFKTSGGKYIASSHIESLFAAVCPLASRMVVHGNQRNYCVALITLDPDAVADWASHHGMAGMLYEQVVASPTMHATVDTYVQQLNTQLNRWEKIKKFVILDHDLTVDSGELTPSMKVRRRVVETNYQEVLDALYTE